MKLQALQFNINSKTNELQRVKTVIISSEMVFPVYPRPLLPGSFHLHVFLLTALSCLALALEPSRLRRLRPRGAPKLAAVLALSVDKPHTLPDLDHPWCTRLTRQFGHGSVFWSFGRALLRDLRRCMHTKCFASQIVQSCRSDHH